MLALVPPIPSEPQSGPFFASTDPQSFDPSLFGGWGYDGGWGYGVAESRFIRGEGGPLNGLALYVGDFNGDSLQEIAFLGDNNIKIVEPKDKGDWLSRLSVDSSQDLFDDLLQKEISFEEKLEVFNIK